MNRLRTLPSVILNNDRSPLKRAEELAIVIGLAATRLRQNLDTQEENLFTNVRRAGLGIAAGVFVLAVLGTWWLLNNGQGATIPYVIVGAVVVLALIAILLVFAPYSKRFRVGGEHAAVTRVSRLYWPVGILPLGNDRAVVWDALTEKETLLEVVDLPPTMGLEQETATAAAHKPDTALNALLSYQAELQSIAPEAVAWPTNLPDASVQQLGAEAGDLWKRMNVLMASDPNAVLGFHAAQGVDTWRAVADEGERVHTFHQEIESLRLLTERYKQRAHHMVDRARELAVEHGFSVMQAVDEARGTHFANSQTSHREATLPTAPGQYLSLNIGNTAEQIKENLSVVQTALKPLDERIDAELTQLARAEEAAIVAVDTNHTPDREQLLQEERNIAQLDSEVLKLAASLDSYQQRILESREKILKGFERIAETPMAQLRSEVQGLQATIVDATTVINGATPQMDLPGLDQTLKELTKTLNSAHHTWTKLATDLPQRGKDVQGRLENIQASLTKVTEGETAPEPTKVNEVLSSVKSVERVARDMVSWTTSQQDPLSPIEDHDQELNQHLVVLRDLRRRLEGASSSFATATSLNGKEPKTTLGLPMVLQRVEQSLGEFIRLADENSAAAAALNNAAETVKKQSVRMEQMLEERNQLRNAYEQKAATLLQITQREREQIKADYAAKREAIANRRAALNRVHDSVNQRVERTLANPVLQQAGVLNDTQRVPWSELVVNQMGMAIDEWGKRVAGIDGTTDTIPLVQQVRDKIEACYKTILDRAVPTTLAPEEHPLSPHICFVPFWYVETEQKPNAEGNTGRMIHIFPPLHLDRPSPTAMPTIEGLRYREISRRVLAYLRRDFINGADPTNALSFSPVVLTDAAKAIPTEAGAPMWQELATALAQHWVFFRSDDTLLNRIVLNSRDHLLPAEQIVEAWLQNAQQPALTDDTSIDN
jgi:hypothetical protein